MADGLFLSLPLHGHTNPSLPLVRQVVTRGDEIVYYSTEPFAGSIERTGARYRPYRNAFLADMCQLPDRLDQLAWLLILYASAHRLPCAVNCWLAEIAFDGADGHVVLLQQLCRGT